MLNFIILLLYIFYTYPSFAQSKAFYFNDIVDSHQMVNSSEYVPLKKVYKYIDVDEGEDNFQLAKKAGLIIDCSDILSISIENVEFHPEDMLVYRIIFRLNASAADKASLFFKNRISKYVALLINNKVFTIGDVLDPVTSEFAVPVFGRTKKQIEIEIHNICPEKLN